MWCFIILYYDLQFSMECKRKKYFPDVINSDGSKTVKGSQVPLGNGQSWSEHMSFSDSDPSELYGSSLQGRLWLWKGRLTSTMYIKLLILKFCFYIVEHNAHKSYHIQWLSQNSSASILCCTFSICWKTK